MGPKILMYDDDVLWKGKPYSPILFHMIISREYICREKVFYHLYLLNFNESSENHIVANTQSTNENFNTGLKGFL